MGDQSNSQSIAPKGSIQMLHPSKPVDGSDINKSNQSMFMLIKELNLPYVKVDQSLRQLHWSNTFVQLTGLKDGDLDEYSLIELGASARLMNFIHRQLKLSVKYEQIIKNVFEHDEEVVNVNVFPEVSSGEKTYYVLLEDLSMQQKFEELLTFQHQMQAVSHIAASVAHELRNPLSVIKGFLQLSHLTCDFQKYYNTIISELNRMNIIIEDFLSVSRKKNNKKWQSPTNLIRSLAELMRAECLLHSVELKVEMDLSYSVCYVNESMFKQVMLNLLRNAIEAYDGNASYRFLQVRSKEVGEFVYIEMIDNGKGMPDEVLSQLGNPFFTTKEKGTGVGIPLCKKIIEDHGGRFTITSETNIGTKVEMVLPLLV